MEAAFFKVQNDFIKHMKSLTKVEFVVLLHLASIMSYGNSILWEPELKELVAQSLGLKIRNFENIISRLIKKEFIFRKGFYLHINDKFLKKGR